VGSSDDAELARAQESRASGVQFQGHGTVIKVTPDDNDGSRHQGFILRSASNLPLPFCNRSPGVKTNVPGNAGS
jgi:hypothetical protein